MIYLDVTSASQSALNTGVKRIQRSLHAWLSRRPDYQPVIWQSAIGRYRTPEKRDLEFLEKPFTRKPAGLGLYDTFVPGIARDILTGPRQFFSSFNLTSTLKPGDLFLEPDLLWDNRGSFFRRSSPGVRKVGVFHDAIALKHPEDSGVDSFFSRRGIKALSAFSAVVCISHDAERDLHHFWRAFGVTPCPTMVIPWPVPFAEQLRPDHPPTFENKEVLYVARLEHRKNHLLLLDACEMLWRQGVEMRLRLIGCKSYPAWTGRVLSRIKALQDAGRDIRWSAHVSDEELHNSYRHCSFTVFPSLSEGFGLPILESLWHGRPVVCGNSGAIAEVAEGGGCETGDMSDVGQLARSMRKLLTDAEFHARKVAEIEGRSFRSWDDYGSDLFKELDQATERPTKSSKSR
jgi:glycosyltransferase involved in cell wall biosynthesis